MSNYFKIIYHYLGLAFSTYILLGIYNIIYVYPVYNKLYVGYATALLVMYIVLFIISHKTTLSKVINNSTGLLYIGHIKYMYLTFVSLNLVLGVTALASLGYVMFGAILYIVGLLYELQLYFDYNITEEIKDNQALMSQEYEVV